MTVLLMSLLDNHWEWHILCCRMQLFIVLFKDTGMSTFLLLLFEPLSIAFDTLQAVVVHGMQLMDTWQRQTLDLSVHTSGLEPSKRSAAGAAWEWRGTLVRNCSFVMDLVSLLLALGHCVHIWWLRGVAFQVVDAILFLNLRVCVSS
jgi:autocrine motility factor receptor